MSSHIKAPKLSNALEHKVQVLECNVVLCSAVQCNPLHFSSVPCQMRIISVAASVAERVWKSAFKWTRFYASNSYCILVLNVQSTIFGMTQWKPQITTTYNLLRIWWLKRCISPATIYICRELLDRHNYSNLNHYDNFSWSHMYKRAVC